MELYILDSQFRRIEVVDRFESFIWSERFAEKGDFELSIISTFENRLKFHPGLKLACNESYRVMEVKSVENDTNSDGRRLLTVKGPSVEDILDDRNARASLSNLTADPKWILTGKPFGIAQKIFYDICVTGVLDPADIIPFIDSVFVNQPSPSSDIPTPQPTIQYEIDPSTSVYEAIKKLCDTYDMGFRITRPDDNSVLYFGIYTGTDRTSQQIQRPAVIFSPNLDNLQNTKRLLANTNFKNVAYVYSPVGHEVIYPYIGPIPQGFDRRVLSVVADDITDTDPAIASSRMIDRGKEELAKYRIIFGFDGELNQNNNYKYGVDYFLGDLVELRDDDGTTNYMRVTEQILVSDKEGDRAYPTLSLVNYSNDQFATY